MGVNFSDDAGVGSTKIAAGTLASRYAGKLLSSILTLDHTVVFSEQRSEYSAH